MFFFAFTLLKLFCIQFGLRFSYNFLLKTIAEDMIITFYDLLCKITKINALIGRLACLHEGM